MDVNFIPPVKEVQIVGEVLGTPLHYAAENRHVSTIQALLDKGADVNLRDRSGNSLLERSIRDGDVWMELKDLLGRRGLI